jgi:hypothetical protein
VKVAAWTDRPVSVVCSPCAQQSATRSDQETPIERGLERRASETCGEGFRDTDVAIAEPAYEPVSRLHRTMDGGHRSTLAL